MSDQPPPYNPGYTSEKSQMAGGPQVMPGMQTAPQQPYPAPGQQPYPPPQQQPYSVAGQQQPYPGPGQPPMAHGQNTVIVQQPGTHQIVVAAPSFGPSPVTMTCATCNKLVTTRTQSNACSGMAWLICGIICLVGLVAGGITWLGCCLIPFCIPDLYDVTHFCPSCNTQVGIYRRMG